MGRLLALLAVLVCGVAAGAVPSSSAFAVSGSFPVRQATPDLTAVTSNNVAGLATVGVPWIWFIDIVNGGTATATFTAGQIVFIDNLPNANVAYGTPTVAPPTGGAGGPLTCDVDFTVRLTCVANGGSVSLPPGGAFRVAVSAVSSTLGAVANPRAGGACTVDPNNNVGEGVGEGNNACADTVTVRGPDLTITKTNNVGGASDVGVLWTWTVTIANAGVVDASFASGRTVAIDNLPNAAVAYGTPAVTPGGGANGPLLCEIDFTVRLTCVANGGTVTMPPGSSFQVAFTATATAPGVFLNPRAGGACLVDPNTLVAESNEGNNACTDQVRVGPDLTATKTNNVGGGAGLGTPWVWIIAVDNPGASAATFASGRIVLVDNLPDAGVTYGTPTVTSTGGANGPLTCTIDFTVRLACVADGGTVTIPAGGGFRIAFSATATAPGIFANPRAGQACGVDPNGEVIESNEGNNACSDQVRAGPDLTVAKVNNVGGSVAVGGLWTWALTITNTGTTVATFSVGQAVLFDHLPTANVTYGTPAMTPGGGASGPLICAIDFTVRLACFATGGVVALPPGGSFQIAFTATASVPAVFASPRAGQTCGVDPTGVVVESNEANNSCGDTVTVAYQVVRPSGVAAGGANNDDDGDENKPDGRRLTETQRHQRSHTNASGQDDYRTEGNVLEVRCDTSTGPQYEVSFPTHTPYLVIATRDGNQQLRLLYDTRSQCQSTQVGDYAEADGDKEHEALFNAHNLTVRKSR